MLDIGSSGYRNSRIRRNADLSGYTGYAELKAATSYDMFLNLSTTKADGARYVLKSFNNKSRWCMDVFQTFRTTTVYNYQVVITK